MLSKRHQVWKCCEHCPQNVTFKSAKEFIRHLREVHCSKEGGSYVCQYGQNNVCCFLPIEGVSDRDYEMHVLKHHVILRQNELRISECISRMEECNAPDINEKQLIDPKDAYQPNLLADQFRWTVFNSTQNLPAVLNDPRRTKREFDFFTKTWGETFIDIPVIPPCPYLMEVSRSHFESYMKKISKRLKQHAKKKVTTPVFCIGEDSVLPLSTARWHDTKLPNIGSVPKIFLQPDFNLENPATFHAVLPWSQLYPPQQKNVFAHQSAKLLQEKLSHYLDIIEVQIARQISLRSEAFFHAMTSHDALMDQLTNVIKAVAKLRHQVHIIDEILVRAPLKILLLKRRHANYIQVYNKIKLMATVHQTQPTIQLLLSTSEFVGALDLIYTTQEVLSQELAGIHSFRHLGSQLAEIEKVIDKMLQNDFVRYVSSDLNRPLTSSEIMEEEQLVAIVFGMLRLHRQSFIETFREEACTAVKATIKQTVIEMISQVDELDLEGYPGSLGEQTSLLDFQKRLDLLQQVFSNLTVLIYRIKCIHEVISNAVTIAAGKTQSFSNQSGPKTSQMSNLTLPLDNEIEIMIVESEYEKFMSALKDMLCSVCDHAHERCAKLLVARTKDGSLEKFSASEFITLAQNIETFSKECENVCGKRSTALRLSLQSQANKFVTRFHEEKKTKLNLLLSNEQWKQADVPTEFQDLVDHISTKGTLTVPKSSLSRNNKERKPQTCLIINCQNYAVVGTVLLLFKMVMEYCQCAEDIPMISPDLLTRLVDLLKFFNSKTSQLLLGAGALQLVGLKTITAKNLALASRCLELMVIYIPYVKAHFHNILQSKQQNMCKHFDELLKDYLNHIQELENKLVSIIGTMFENQLSKWEVKAPVPSSCFRSISKQLTKFHEALCDILPSDMLMDLFARIHSDFKVKLRNHLVRLHVVNDGGPQHGLVTQEFIFYVQSLKSLNVFPNTKSMDNTDDLWPAR